MKKTTYFIYIYSRVNLKSLASLALLLSMITYVSGDETLSIVGDAIYDKETILKCSSDSIGNLVGFRDPCGEDAGGCLSSGKCFSRKGYKITQDVDKNTTSLTIPKCSPSFEGIWECYQTTITNISLTCLHIPEQLTMVAKNLKKNTVIDIHSGITVECFTGCTCPKPKFEFQYVDAGNKSQIYFENRKDGKVNHSATASLQCKGLAKAYYQRVVVLVKKEIQWSKSFRVKCILRVPSATVTFPSALSVYTIKACNANGVWIAFYFLGGLMIVMEFVYIYVLSNTDVFIFIRAILRRRKLKLSMAVYTFFLIFIVGTVYASLIICDEGIGNAFGIMFGTIMDVFALLSLAWLTFCCKGMKKKTSLSMPRKLPNNRKWTRMSTNGV